MPTYTRNLIAFAIAAVALAIAATSASAATTRAEYVAQVDPICQASKPRLTHEVRSYERRIRHLIQHGLDPDRPTKQALRVVVRFYDQHRRDRAR